MPVALAFKMENKALTSPIEYGGRFLYTKKPSLRKGGVRRSLGEDRFRG